MSTATCEEIFRTSRSGVGPDFRLHIRLWTLGAYHGVDFAKAGCAFKWHNVIVGICLDLRELRREDAVLLRGIMKSAFFVTIFVIVGGVAILLAFPAEDKRGH